LGSVAAILDQLVEAEEIEFLVDEARTLAVELVGEPAGTEDDDLEVPGVGGDRAPHRLSECQAASGRGQRMLHGVHHDRHHLDRAHRLVRPQQFHGYRGGVVNLQFLARGDVEFLADQSLDDVPRQFGIAGQRRKRLQAPALVGVAILGRGTHGEGRHFIEEEAQAMVVVEDHRDVRPVLGQPAVHRRETVEERLEVRVLLQAAVDGHPDHRDM
jgi:hypothetical protein